MLTKITDAELNHLIKKYNTKINKNHLPDIYFDYQLSDNYELKIEISFCRNILDFIQADINFSYEICNLKYNYIEQILYLDNEENEEQLSLICSYEQLIDDIIQKANIQVSKYNKLIDQLDILIKLSKSLNLTEEVFESLVKNKLEWT